MGCPIVCCMAAASPGGLYSLLVQDREGRVMTSTVLASYSLAWAAYFGGVAPESFASEARIGLEACFVVLWIAAYYRVRWLMRNRGIVPPFSRAISKVFRVGSTLTSSPWIWASKGWLLCMVVLEWRGRHNFSPGEYALVAGTLMALIALRGFTLVRARSARSSARSSPLLLLEEVYARQHQMPQGMPTETRSVCPLGFGGAQCDSNCGRAVREDGPRGSDLFGIAAGNLSNDSAHG